MSLPVDFHFLRPAALLLLLALPLCWYAWRHGRTDAGAWRGAVDAHLLPHLLERVDGGSGRGGLALAAALWVLGALALAGPAWEREPMPLYHNQAARVLALELAPSMGAQDVKPSRLERARYKLDDILTRSRDHQTALLGYAGDAFVAAPLTDDVETVRNLVDALDPTTMPVIGNATGRAIDAAAALIGQAGLHRGEIILLADTASHDATAAARRAHKLGFDVSVLGIGTPSGAPVALAQGDFLKDDDGNVVISRLDEAALRAVAVAGGGRYASLSADGSDLDELLASTVDVDTGSGRTDGEAESARWRDRGPWLLLALLPLALASFRRGWLMMLAFVALAPSPRAHAASLSDLWQRADQQTAAALAAGDAKRAAELAPTPEWRGGAAYRSGDFAAAESAYAQSGGADGAYNRGNALAKLGRYEEAIAAYDEALKRDPGMTDAVANRKAVEDFMRERKQQDPKQGQQQPRDGKDPSQQGASQPGEQPKSSDDAREPGDGKGESADDAQKQDGRQNDHDTRDGEPGKQQGQGEQEQRQDGDTRQDQAGKAPDEQGAQDSAQRGGQQQDAAAADAKAGGQTPDSQQQQALKQALDRALADPGKDAASGDPAHALQEATEDDATREKRQALEHWLERVPDDPGGLLRRKFQLEYQRRQQRGGDGG
ncbi:tetratricopeptide repeat protein [Dokdonella sp.]|uniref:tetratricopeptide repeat protein n=1 Tax=Dokdonella sp. TaxID=2291710 RepID=UPI002F4162F7